ncbi:MAG: hypothetical protein EOS10_00145 [Mesorhizobium sp.]|uniref:hypothetical protein n=1 Tax=Mesorhizobium sp. TaxID=1871066 RepID=UPI000FE84892|nr:hypothetical protein [Mesorhizobium sp.]RWO34749.1 MAG: hypothetical protein EOS10_00145 [Mesorhizobium sp.]
MIPNDIRDAAIAVVDRGWNVGLIHAVAEALMAERERCAKIAEFATPFFPGLPSHHENNICVGEDIKIARLIRSDNAAGKP